jgi:hypothetical protein
MRYTVEKIFLILIIIVVSTPIITFSIVPNNLCNKPNCNSLPCNKISTQKNKPDSLPSDKNITNQQRGLTTVSSEHSSLIAPLATTFAAIVSALIALYLGSWRDSLKKPKLAICFSEDGKDPYFRALPFNPFYELITVDGTSLEIFKPMLNIRIKVENYGKSTARKVQARVEKVELYEDDSNKLQTIYYHPTKVKWSGEYGWNPVDIVAGSHFFLDVLHVLNENTDYMCEYHYELYNKQLSKKKLKAIINQVHQDNDRYWNLWIEDPPLRGLPDRYLHEGKSKVHFLVESENSKPIKFVVELEWVKNEWDNPKVKIQFNNKYINKIEET